MTNVGDRLRGASVRLVGAVLLVMTGGTATAGTFQEVSGFVVMEAENATKVEEYAVESNAQASGGKGMRVTRATKAGNGALAFDFVVATGGRYIVYIRTLCDDHLNNGLWLKLDGKQVVAPPTDKYAGVKDIYLSRPGWYWRPRWQGPGMGNHGGLVTIDVTPGRHTLTIVKRLSETPFIDKVVLGIPGLPGPQDLGPPETLEGATPIAPLEPDAGGSSPTDAGGSDESITVDAQADTAVARDADVPGSGKDVGASPSPKRPVTSPDAAVLEDESEDVPVSPGDRTGSCAAAGAPVPPNGIGMVGALLWGACRLRRAWRRRRPCPRS